VTWETRLKRIADRGPGTEPGVAVFAYKLRIDRGFASHPAETAQSGFVAARRRDKGE
jgi:hypothetical protein